MAVITTLTKEQEERLNTEHMAEVSGIGITPQREIDNDELMDIIAQINDSSSTSSSEATAFSDEPEEDVLSEDEAFIPEEDEQDFNDMDESGVDLEDSYAEQDGEDPGNEEPEYEDPEYDDYELEEPEYDENPVDNIESDSKQPESNQPEADPILQPAEKLKTVTTDTHEPFVVKNLPQNKAVQFLLYFGIYNVAAWIIALLVYFF